MTSSATLSEPHEQRVRLQAEVALGDADRGRQRPRITAILDFHVNYLGTGDAVNLDRAVESVATRRRGDIVGDIPDLRILLGVQRLQRVGSGHALLRTGQRRDAPLPAEHCERVHRRGQLEARRRAAGPPNSGLPGLHGDGQAVSHLGGPSGDAGPDEQFPGSGIERPTGFRHRRSVSAAGVVSRPSSNRASP